MDDSNEMYIKEYNSLYHKMNLHLPDFYFSLRPNYSFDTNNQGFDIYEKRLISMMSDSKYSKEYISKILAIVDQFSDVNQRRLLNSVDLDQIDEKLSLMNEASISSLVASFQELISQKASYKVNWHYPVVKFNGLQNQYHYWLSNIIKGDFGISLLDARPVTDKLWDAMKWSLVLLFLNLFFSMIFAFPIGVYNGMHPNSTFDKVSNSFLFAFYSIPKFWIATIFIIFFTTSEYGSWTNIFPSVGLWYPDGAQGFMEMLSNSWTNLILPVLILVIPDVAYLGRLIRSNVQEESNKEYVKTALSKGMSLKDITSKHILPNSLIPSITLLVGALPGAIASALVIEVIFNIPGIGRLLFLSIKGTDWAMVYPIVLVMSVFAVILFLLGDILMAFLNPKINLK